MFDEKHVLERCEKGELLSLVTYDKPPHPKSHQPLGTRSQVVSYYDKQMNLVATADQYLLPDGSLGASGKPDPTSLSAEGVLYVRDT